MILQLNAEQLRIFENALHDYIVKQNENKQAVNCEGKNCFDIYTVYEKNEIIANQIKNQLTSCLKLTTPCQLGKEA